MQKAAGWICQANVVHPKLVTFGYRDISQCKTDEDERTFSHEKLLETDQESIVKE